MANYYHSEVPRCTKRRSDHSQSDHQTRMDSRIVRLQRCLAATMMMVLLVACSSCIQVATGFSLSMVASRAPYTDRRLGSSPSTSSSSSSSSPWGIPSVPPSLIPISPVTDQLSSSLVSSLAEVALKARLADQTGVKVDVTANPTDLIFQGKVGPVTVQGRGWKSKLGLTCRAIEATVDSCLLDVRKILSQRKLRLITPARGNAMVALNSADFTNFIAHPLMKPPGLVLDNTEHTIKFLKEGTEIDAQQGTVTFIGTIRQHKYRLCLQRGTSSDRRAIVTAQAVDHTDTSAVDLADTVAQVATNFFNTLVFELDGTFLCFRDMMTTSKGDSSNVMISLSIVVHKFPSSKLAF